MKIFRDHLNSLRFLGFGLSFVAASGWLSGQNGANPFLRPGSNRPPPAPAVNPNPTPTAAPKPVNPNLELRGYFRYRGVDHFSIFDKVKNRGFWLVEGLSNDAGVEVGSFDPEKDELRLKNGTTLTLRASSGKTLPVPGQGKSKPSSVAKKAPQTRTVPVRAANGTIIRRTVNIPPRKPTAAGTTVVVPGRPVPPGSTRPSSAPGGRVRMVGQPNR